MINRSSTLVKNTEPGSEVKREMEKINGNGKNES
jgi:hypothetical protein